MAAKLPPGFAFDDHTSGVPVTSIQAWMGHADLATTMIYIHCAPSSTDAAGAIAAAFRVPMRVPI